MRVTLFAQHGNGIGDPIEPLARGKEQHLPRLRQPGPAGTAAPDRPARDTPPDEGRPARPGAHRAPAPDETVRIRVRDAVPRAPVDPVPPATAPDGPWHGPLSRRLEQHFVYNTLNTIASLVRTDPPRARELLLGFADTLGSVALLVGFGVMLGRLLEVTGKGVGGTRYGLKMAVRPTSSGCAFAVTIDLGGPPLFGPIGSVAARTVKGDIERSIEKFETLYG